jgi:hypothetical protein
MEFIVTVEILESFISPVILFKTFPEETSLGQIMDWIYSNFQEPQRIGEIKIQKK